MAEIVLKPRHSLVGKDHFGLMVRVKAMAEKGESPSARFRAAAPLSDLKEDVLKNDIKLLTGRDAGDFLIILGSGVNPGPLQNSGPCCHRLGQ